MWAFQENIYNKMKKTYYVSTSSTGRQVVGFGDISIGSFLEVSNSQILYLIDYIAYGLRFGIKYKLSRRCAENQFPHILAYALSVLPVCLLLPNQ